MTSELVGQAPSAADAPPSMTSPAGPARPGTAASPRLQARGVTIGYDQRTVCDDLSIAIPDSAVTVIVGPNACGKSTLLRGLARLLKTRTGEMLLDGKALARYGAKDLARQLGLMAQSSTAPDGITVADLVARGRYPYRKLLAHWSVDDERATVRAMERANIFDLAARRVEELSGGQRQRVWIAMVLAQETPMLLLDEPTTYLDIAHQIDVLDLCRELNEDLGRTLVLVLHDLNHACRYADHIVAMRDGAIVAQGAPATTITERLVRDVFGLRCRIIDDPVTHTPLVVPERTPRSSCRNAHGGRD